MELTPQQLFEDKNHQFGNQLEELQDAQLDNKKALRNLENLQERFHLLQQQEQKVYQGSLNEVDPEERSFFEERHDEGLHLSRKIQQELEEDREQLEQERRNLFEKEESVNAAHKAFLKTEREATSSGA
ncbi:DUF3958 family protein [Enterococcus sp. 5H]|uniref:DUF3958 family protein n=1 Tax=Enterococcus sp. 5H TaxID=1229490 RepID=UPI002302DB0C|nr:DUF3958 family protein [Enterococcus sp. 5H]MDA9472021.1 hypothetical protein [Enterococcus sp. 5H]